MKLFTALNLLPAKSLRERLDLIKMESMLTYYEGFFFIKREEPIVLLTEKNEIVSLYSILTGPRGHNSRMIGLTRTIYRQDITSNIAVIGQDEWASEEYTLSEAGDGRLNTTSACSYKWEEYLIRYGI